MTAKEDIQANSWTDEPEIPNSRRDHEGGPPDSEPPTKREGPSSREAASEPADDEQWESGAPEQRPPSDS